MKKIIPFLFFTLTLAADNHNRMEFLYPVAQINDNNVLLLHQKSLDDVELWRWNKNEKIAFKELNSVFLPSFIQLLPSKLAFSFMDRGRIKIKYFAKRTPRSIDIYEPISAISNINWIDDEHFYFVGKHEGHFKIFLCNISDHQCIISCLNSLDNDLDYLYPQKISDFLFCIVKNHDGEYAICKLDWVPKIYKNELHLVMQTRHEKLEPDKILTHSNESIIALLRSFKPLCFLNMRSEDFGFVLEFIPEKSEGELFAFSCYKLTKDSNQAWFLKKLFDFQLPKNLLIGSESEKIYESIYPFLPRYAPEFIYFVHFDQDLRACQIMRYNQNLDQVEIIMQKFMHAVHPGAHFFAPLITNDAIYSGISILKPAQDFELMCADQTSGIFQCQLPEAQL